MSYFKRALIAVSASAIMLMPVMASADLSVQKQIDQLMAQIAALQAQVQILQQQPSVAVQWCHTFNKNLGVGVSGDDEQALENVLAREGFSVEHSSNFSSVFNEQIASAVTGFQEKYKDEILTPNNLQYGTGYVGAATRKKLNQLYGCGITTMPPKPIIDSPVINGISGPTSLNVGETGTWTVKAIANTGKGILNYSVVWGDEVYASTNGVGATSAATQVSQTSTFTHSYNRAGTFFPVFTVTRPDGPSAQASISVNVGSGGIESVQVVYLNKPFNLSVGSLASVVDYKNLRIKFSGINQSTIYCIKAPCPSNQSVGLEVILPETGAPATHLSLMVGEKKEVFGSTIYLQSLTNSVATFVVSAPVTGGKIQVLSPNGGEYLYRGLKAEVVWLPSSFPNSMVFDIYLLPLAASSCPSGATCTTTSSSPRYLISKGFTGNKLQEKQLFNWTVGNAMNIGNNIGVPDGAYYVQVCDAGTINCDQSDSYFKIVSNSVTGGKVQVLSPNGGEQWQVGQAYVIKWGAQGLDTDEKVRVYLDKYHLPGSEKAGQINSSINLSLDEDQNGGLTYNVPQSLTSWPGLGDTYKIRVCNSSDCNMSDSSDSFFSIQDYSAPVIISPVAGAPIYRPGTLTVSVQPKAGATGYLYGFFQDANGDGLEEMVHENFRDYAKLDGSSYSVDLSKGFTYQNSTYGFKDNTLRIVVRALINNQWTEAGVVDVNVTTVLPLSL